VNLDLVARYGPRMLEGLLVTVELVVISVAIGFAIALPMALARLSPSRLSERSRK
jgi:polar amino acid transport system permease protein